jgi:hypothetical protein
VVQNLIADDFDHFERLLIGNRVDQHVSVDTDRMAGVKDGVLILRVC